MAKTIVIAEGGTAKTLTAEKLRTTLSGGGSQNWIPEDEADKYAKTKKLTARENGVYKASDDDVVGYSEVNVELPLKKAQFRNNGVYSAAEANAAGFSEVEVSVAGAESLGEKTITQNGVYDPRDDGFGGYSLVTVNTQGGGSGGGAWVDITQTANATITPTTDVTSTAKIVKVEYLFAKDFNLEFYIRFYVDYGTDSNLTYDITADLPKGIDGLYGYSVNGKDFSNQITNVTVVNYFTLSFRTTTSTESFYLNCFCANLSILYMVVTSSAFIVYKYVSNIHDNRYMVKRGDEKILYRYFNTDVILIVKNSPFDGTNYLFYGYGDQFYWKCCNWIYYNDKILFYYIQNQWGGIPDTYTYLYMDSLKTNNISGIDPVYSFNTNEKVELSYEYYSTNEDFWDYCIGKLGGGDIIKGDVQLLDWMAFTTFNFAFSNTIGDSIVLVGRGWTRTTDEPLLFSNVVSFDGNYTSYLVLSKSSTMPEGTNIDYYGGLNGQQYILQTESQNTFYGWTMVGWWEGSRYTVTSNTNQKTKTFTFSLPYFKASNDGTIHFESSDEFSRQKANLILDLYAAL